VGSLSIVGEEAQISPSVRVWPSKQIESGATLNINLFGVRPRNAVWSAVQGYNIDITPEFAVVGRSIWLYLEAWSQVTVSRDQRSISRMVTVINCWSYVCGYRYPEP